MRCQCRHAIFSFRPLGPLASFCLPASLLPSALLTFSFPSFFSASPPLPPSSPQAVGASRVIEEKSLGGPGGPGAGLHAAISSLLLDPNARAEMRNAALAAARPDAADTIAAKVLKVASHQVRRPTCAVLSSANTIGAKSLS